MAAPDPNLKLNLSASGLAAGLALVLVVAKLWALLATGALSIGASLADSALDLIMSGGGLLAIRYAAKPADADHAFGHTAAEDLAALGQAIFVTVSALILAALAALRLRSGAPPQLASEGLGIGVILASLAATAALVIWQRRVAARTGNKVVAADSLHYIGDLVPGLGALIALGASATLGWSWPDPVIALAAAAWMILGAWRIGHGAWDALMDKAAPTDVEASIARIAADFPGVHGIHDLKTRQSGSRLFINLHVELDGSQTLTEAHAIGAALRRAIITRYPQADVLIHKDPVGVIRHPADDRPPPRHRP